MSTVKFVITVVILNDRNSRIIALQKLSGWAFEMAMSGEIFASIISYEFTNLTKFFQLFLCAHDVCISLISGRKTFLNCA